MAGPAHLGELTLPHAHSSGADFSLAGPADGAELRAFLKQHPTPGKVSLRFEKEPDYFASDGVAGAVDKTITARRDGRLICVGRCSRRSLYINGERTEVGYLSELRLAPKTSRGLAVLREGYAFFAQLERAHPAQIYFTSVAQTNERARSVLESGRLGLPRYQPLADLVTLALPVRKSSQQNREETPPDAAELIEFLDAEAKKNSFTQPWDETTLSALAAHNLCLADFSVVRRQGRIVAAGALWDQSGWRQTIVHGYSGTWRAWRPLLNPVFKLTGWPTLPDTGQRLRQACVHPFALAYPSADLAQEVLDKLKRQAARRGIEWLLVALDQTDPLLATIGASLGAHRYETTLYTVSLQGIGPAVRPPSGTIRPEVGLL